jgi:hypothetical protein
MNNTVGYNPKLHEVGAYGINKKKFFKNNLHHAQQVLLYGTHYDTRSSVNESRPPQQNNEEYWTEYRRNYEY